jgi:hypothetical protein
MSGNFGTPKPQPFPLSQAPVHKVTEWRTIQKYHFFGGLSGIISQKWASSSWMPSIEIFFLFKAWNQKNLVIEIFILLMVMEWLFMGLFFF